MRKGFPNLVRLLVVLAMVCGLVAIVTAPASAISDLAVQNTPETAGAPAKWAFDFIADADGDGGYYTAGVDTFTITFPPEVTVPTSISKSSITLSANGQTGNPPIDADIDGQAVTITVPAVDFGLNAFDNIAGGDEVAIIISSSAGIRNPPAVDTDWELTVEGAFTIGTEEPVTGYFDTVAPTAKITLSPTYGPRGTSLKVSGTGFTPSYVAQIGNWNGEYGDVTLGFADISSTGTFSATFTVTKPPFYAGENWVWAEDGGTKYAEAEFTLKAGITLKPTSGRPGETIKIIATDTFGSELGADIYIGVDDVGNVPDGPWDGTANAQEVVIPGELAPGKVKVSLVDDNGLCTADLTILGQPVTVTPASGGALTKVTITGSGFTGDSFAYIQLGGIDWADDVEITTAGSFTAQVTLTAAMWEDLGAGTWPVWVEDDEGRIGVTEFTIPEPALTLSQEESGIGSTIVATGTGFSVRKMFSIYYDGEDGELVLSGTTSGTGTFTAGFKVPATIGDVDVVPGGEYDVVAVDTVGATATATHTVSTGTVTTTPEEAQVGDSITVSLAGFQPYTKVDDAELDGKNILPSVDQWTDSKGKVTFTTRVPGAARVGPTIVIVWVGDTSSSTAFTVLEAPVTVADALESIMDKVTIVWGLINGEWKWYDPNDLPGNTLESLDSGTGYYIKVSADCTLIYGAFVKDLKAAFWNNVGWP